MRTLATRGAIWSHSDSYVAVYIMGVRKDMWMVELEDDLVGM